jgi:hypothetical protein
MGRVVQKNFIKGREGQKPGRNPYAAFALIYFVTMSQSFDPLKIYLK